MTQEQLDKGYDLQEEIQSVEHELSKLKTYFFEPTGELFLYTMKGVSHYVTVPENKYGVVYQLMYDTYTQELLRLKEELFRL